MITERQSNSQENATREYQDFVTSDAVTTELNKSAFQNQHCSIQSHLTNVRDVKGDIEMPDSESEERMLLQCSHDFAQVDTPYPNPEKGSLQGGFQVFFSM